MIPSASELSKALADWSTFRDATVDAQRAEQSARSWFLKVWLPLLRESIRETHWACIPETHGWRSYLQADAVTTRRLWSGLPPERLSWLPAWETMADCAIDHGVEVDPGVHLFVRYGSQFCLRGEVLAFARDYALVLEKRP